MLVNIEACAPENPLAKPYNSFKDDGTQLRIKNIISSSVAYVVK
jgi:hypothetical protein